MKNIFVVFQVSYSGKYRAVVDTIHAGENLLSHTARYKADVCHLCESKKEAHEIADMWNAAFEANGTNLY